MSGLTHNVSAQADELLDHIYEYGTNSEGVIPRINQLCDAAVEQLRAELAASREREARMRALIADDSYAMTFQSFGQYRAALLKALTEGAQEPVHRPVHRPVHQPVHGELNNEA